MKRAILKFGVMLATTVVGSAVYAADHAGGTNLAPLAAAIAIGLGAFGAATAQGKACLLYTSPSPRD